MAPSLELTYNSFSSDVASPVGYGWSLSVPSIQVVNKTGVEDLYDSTFFTSSLSGELKPVALTDATHGTYGAKVETGPYLTYAFETDGSWMVTDGEGRTYTFGSTSDSQVVDPSDATRIYRWMLEEIRDTNDNYVEFTYVKDQEQIVPSTISYTGNGTTDGVFLVTFTYETRDDASTSYASGFAVETNKRVSNVTISVDGDMRQAYELDYTTGDNGVRSMLASITQTSYAQDGTTTSVPSTTFSYSTSTLSWTQDSAYSIPKCFSQNEGYDCATRVSDVNGDALPDLVYAPGDSTVSTNVYLNNGDGTGWSSDASYTIPVRFMSDHVSAAQGVELFDVNGDGLDDMIHGEGDDPYDSDSDPDRDVYINNADGTGWTMDSTYVLPLDFVKNQEPYTMSDRFVRLGDFNGDGLLDLISGGSPYDTYGTNYVNNGDGTGWTESTDFSNGGPDFGTASGIDGGVRLVDVNHDGLVDAIYAPLGSSAVYINDSDDYGTSDPSYAVPSMNFSYGGYDGGARLADANGDGLIDILVADDIYDTNAIYLNDGDGTGWSLATGTLPEEFNQYNLWSNPYDRGVRLMDVNGDGLVDIVRYDDTSSSGGSAVYLHDGEVADLLTSVTTSQGSQIDVTYVASSQTRENLDLPFTVQVAQDITTSDGLGTSNTTSYTYAEGSFYFEDAQNREFAGFGTITQTDADGNVTTTYLHQGNGDDSASSESGDNASKIGKAYRVERSDSASALYELVVTDWDSTDLGNDRDFVSMTSEVRLQYDGGSTHADTASAYTYDTNTGVLLTQIEYGEVSASSDGTFTDSGFDDRTTTYVYAVDSSGVITSLPATITMTDTDAVTVSQTRYTYDGLSLGSVSTGNVTQQETWISGTDYAASTFTYDTYGNVLTQTDPNGNTTTSTYDSYNLYPITVQNALLDEQDFEYDYASGKVTRAQDANGTIVETDYDGLGRPVEERRSSTDDAATLVTTKTWSYYDDTTYYPDAPRSVKLREYLSETLYKETIQYLDGLDRVVETKMLDDEATGYNETETAYDTLGRVSSTTLAGLAVDWLYDANTVSSDLLETYAYDALSRVTSVTNVLGTTSTSYDGFTKTIIDAVGNQKAYETDGLGRLVEVIENLDGTAYSTTYEWSAADKLTSLTDALGNVRAFTYDGRGLRLTAQDLHAASDSTYGTWTYTYDEAGNLASSLSPNGITVTYAYDELHRATSEDADDASGIEVSYAYDSCTGGTGKLCEAAVNGGSTTSYTYDSTGNIDQETVTIDSTAYMTSYTYDRQGNVLTITHPDSTVVTYTYNTLGTIETVTGIVSSTDYGPHGQVTSQINADGTLTTYTYNETARYRLTRKVTTGYQAGEATTSSTTLYAGSGDGSMYKNSANWDTAHDATSAGGANPTGTVAWAKVGLTAGGVYGFNRAFLVFDTSSLPDDATLTSATLKLYVNSVENGDDDGNDWITLVQGTQASATTLTADDYDQAGSVDAPTEGIDSTDRADLSSVSSGSYLSFPLNTTGVSWISLTDSTLFALREGHDILDTPYDGAFASANALSFKTSEMSGDSMDPVLELTYFQPASGSSATAATLQDLSYTYDGIGNITQIVDASDTDTARTVDYVYDDLYRLTSATTTGSVAGDDGAITYTYDALGNITYRSDVGIYSYDGTDYANPHAVTSILNTDGTTVTFSYDNNGNFTDDSSTGSEPSATYAWDYKNRLVSSGQTSTTTTETTTSATTSIYAGSGDGSMYKNSADWDTAHDATSAGGANPTGTVAWARVGKTAGSAYGFNRAFLAFDTSSLPDDATLTSATLKLYVNSVESGDDDGDDWVTVLQGSQASATTLTVDDYDTAGSVDSPTEGIDSTDRADLSSITVGAYLSFPLNTTGLSWISLNDSTLFALREGHDVLDSAYAGVASTGNALSFKTSEYAGTGSDPYLTVTYTQTTATTTTTTANALTYTYDHAMRRVSKTTDDGTTLYPTLDYSVEDSTTTVYVYGSSGLVASVKDDGTTSTTSTIHTDHLGSTSVVTDEDGIMIELLDYNPYGTERISWSSSSSDGEAETQKTYIGEYSDQETDLSYLNARYYDPDRGQFLGQDVVFRAFGVDGMSNLFLLLDPQQQNSYNYARNNPLTYSDPAGESILSDFYNGLKSAYLAIVRWFSGNQQTITTSVTSPTPTLVAPTASSPTMSGKTWDPVTDQRIGQLDQRLQQPATDFINEVESQFQTQLRITQGFRSIEEQNTLYAQGRTTSGNIVTNAKGGESYHNYGLAFDVVVMENGQTNWNKPITQEIADTADGFGFEWGGGWSSFPDYPHFQKTFGQSISDLKED